ncbi:MAG TPA: hypothetical protein P5132_09250, partial [Bacteroidales bacterium]|nr:hypothetical protein [Bacteroidales bacterium]
PQAWELIKNAKSTVTQLINNAASRVKPDTNALVLSKLILEDLMAQDKSPVAYALDFLKKEIRQLF